MGATKYFKNAFAEAGDKEEVPNDLQPGGTVSYAEGFGEKYELDQATNPAALDVPRSNTNQLFFDVTLALQQYQEIGIPNFISTSDNEGDPFPYEKGAYARYDDGVNGSQNYQSLVDNNTSLPTDGTKWRLVDKDGSALAINNVIFESSVVNGNIVYFDAVNSRFDEAVANGATEQNAIGFADVTNKRVITQGLVTGLTGLTAGAIYYLSTTTPGSITDTAPTNNVVRVGIALTSTTLLLNIENIDGFTHVSAASGYTFLPNGLILQWGGTSGNIADNTSQDVLFPIAFPNNVFRTAVTWVANATTASITGTFGGNFVDNATMRLVNEIGVSASATFFAIGN